MALTSACSHKQTSDGLAVPQILAYCSPLPATRHILSDDGLNPIFDEFLTLLGHTCGGQ